jgi:hypothetical protein
VLMESLSPSRSMAMAGLSLRTNVDHSARVRRIRHSSAQEVPLPRPGVGQKVLFHVSTGGWGGDPPASLTELTRERIVFDPRGNVSALLREVALRLPKQAVNEYLAEQGGPNENLADGMECGF